MDLRRFVKIKSLEGGDKAECEYLSQGRPMVPWLPTTPLEVVGRGGGGWWDFFQSVLSGRSRSVY